jgi:hypothetical protein
MENYPQADKEVRDLATELWGATPEKQHDYGKGKVFTNTSLEEIFKILNLQPDFKTSNKDDLHYTHRRSGDTDIYFVTNQSKKKIQVTPQFRVSGKQPEFWDAVMASTRPLPAYIQNEATTSVPLQLDVNQSAFIVFRPGGKPKTDALSANFPEPELITEVSTPWQVSFESDAIKRGPAETVDFPTLSDWSQSNNPQIRYYSGTAVYKTVIDGLNVDKSKGNIMLDLGKVGVMAKVKINGKYAGGAWTPPYLVDVTKFIQNGRNELEVEVVSNWANRIIGDRNLPEAERQLRLHFGPRGNDPLMESGLIGPVKITRIPGKTRSI